MAKLIFWLACEGVFAIQGNPDPQRELRPLVSMNTRRFEEGSNMRVGELDSLATTVLSFGSYGFALLLAVLAWKKKEDAKAFMRFAVVICILGIAGGVLERWVDARNASQRNPNAEDVDGTTRLERRVTLDDSPRREGDDSVRRTSPQKELKSGGRSAAPSLSLK